MKTPAWRPSSATVRWCVFNFGMLVAAWFGLFEGIHWAYNILAFLTGVMVFNGLASLSSKTQKIFQARGRSVPKAISVSNDIALVVLCAASGSFWLAAAWVWSAIAEEILYGEGTQESSK